MHLLKPIITLLLSSYAAAEKCDAKCSDAKTYWDYWWYGVGSELHCLDVDEQNCKLAKTESKTVGWSLTNGVELGFSEAKGLTGGFSSSFTWTESYTASMTYEVSWKGDKTGRLWMKQWFAVTEAQCQPCTLAITPKGGQHAIYGDAEFTKTWVPCKEGSCMEYQVSDANAKCDKENHCQQD